jgi:hypothetical protein
MHIFITSVLAGGEWLALRPGLFTPGTIWKGCCLDPKAGVDNVEKRKYLTLPGLELRPPLLVQPIACRYSDYAIPAP